MDNPISNTGYNAVNPAPLGPESSAPKGQANEAKFSRMSKTEEPEKAGEPGTSLEDYGPVDSFNDFKEMWYVDENGELVNVYDQLMMNMGVALATEADKNQSEYEEVAKKYRPGQGE
jgi:hypothetical protein